MKIVLILAVKLSAASTLHFGHSSLRVAVEDNTDDLSITDYWQIT